jgi:hypothetical protein
MPTYILRTYHHRTPPSDAHKHAYTQTRTRKHTYMHTHVRTHACKRARMHARKLTHGHTRAHTNTCTHTRACTPTRQRKRIRTECSALGRHRSALGRHRSALGRHRSINAAIARRRLRLQHAACNASSLGMGWEHSVQLGELRRHVERVCTRRRDLAASTLEMGMVSVPVLRVGRIHRVLAV